MASWSQTFSVNNKYSLTLTVTEQSTDVANNTSTVAYSLVMATAANSFTGYSDYRTTISLALNGTTLYSYNASRNFNAAAASSYSETLTSGTTTITHNADGTKSITCAASVSVASGTYSPGSASISQSLTLTTIPRASTCSWSGDFVIGTAKSITITRASSSFQHKLKFTVGSASETVPSGSYATTSYSWTPASGTYASQFPTQTSRSGTLVLYTYSGSTLIGSNSYSFTLKIPDSWKPTAPSITLSPYSTNAFVSGNSLYVAGYSCINIAATSTASSGTTISSWTISGAVSATKTGSSLSYRSGVIATSGSKSVTVTVTDARGRTASASSSCSFLSYAIPAVSTISYNRGTYSGGVWTSSDTGTDLRVAFKASCSLSSQGNTMTYSATVVTVNASGSVSNNGTKQMYKTGIGTTTAYNVTVTLTDTVGNTVSRSVYVPTIEIPFVIDPAKPAVGVGAVPQTARTLELAENWMVRTGGITGIHTASGYNASAKSNLIVPVERLSFPGQGDSATDYCTAWLKYICANYPNYSRCYFIGPILGNTSGFIQCLIYDTSAVDANGLPQYSCGVMNWYTAYATKTYNFGTSSYVFNCYTVGPIRTKDFTHTVNQTIAANSRISFTHDVTLYGFAPVGIISIRGSGTNGLSYTDWYMASSNSIGIYLFNGGNTSQTVNSISFTVLYM